MGWPEVIAKVAEYAAYAGIVWACAWVLVGLIR
jgi:hypothetical protein